MVQATHQLLSVPALTDIFSDVEAFCAIIAAAAHDVGHLGVNNLFLTATQSPLAILYNDQVCVCGVGEGGSGAPSPCDMHSFSCQLLMPLLFPRAPGSLQSVLENHHAATCFKLMAREECNIFAPLPTDTRVACR